jgi:hypothetical protein
MAAGGAYAVHKHNQRRQQEAYDQGQYDEEQQYDEAPEEEAAPPPAASTDVAGQLTQLKALLDSGALTQQEFDAEKQKILNS